jgi:predicted flap endonuclease-1-like 5' DNA nuclease
VATSGRDVGRPDREASQVAPEAGSLPQAEEEVLRIEPDIGATAVSLPEPTPPSIEATEAPDDIETTPASGDRSAQPDPSVALPAVDLTAELLALAPVQSPPTAATEVVAADLSAADAEAAAMRAIEGSWTPGRRAQSAEAPAGPAVEAPPELAEPMPVASAEPPLPETAIDMVGDETEPDLIVAEDDEDVVATAEVGSLAEVPDVLPQHEEDRILPAESSEESGPDAIELDLPPARIGAAPAAQDQPPGLGAPRHGMRDDLTQIVGVLPVVETTLNRLGVYHFDQVAEWSDANANWVETHLGIAGRVEREHWREQAHELAAVASGKRPHRKKRPS